MNWSEAVREELEGLVPYAPGLRASQVRERSGRDNILKLSSNEHPAGPVPAAVAGMSAVLGRLNRYPDGACLALREKLAARHRVSIEQVVVGNGSNELLRIIAQALLRPGDDVVFGWPSFIVYSMACQLFGATEVKVPLKDDTYDLEAMAEAITERTRIVFLCNPNNPTGTAYGRAELEAFLAKVPDHVLVVADEAYFEFVTKSDYPDTMAYFDGERPLVVMRTFSKMYSLAGLRVGYALAPEPLALAMHKVREPFNVNTVAQVAAYYSLDDESEVRRRRAENQEQKTYLYSAFDRLGVAYAPSEANFVWIKTEKPVEVFDALLDEGIIARSFGIANALRLGVGTAEDTKVTIEAFERIADRLGGI